MSLPHYYSSLGPFLQLFLSGHPILTYHHVGPRKRGARIKGLYVSARLFARQLRELKEAGFITPPYGTVAARPSSPGLQVFLTFDDGFRDVFEHALPVLRAQQFCGIQFLVSELIGKTNEWQQRAGDVSEPLMDEAQVREWLAAGQEIGSHTRTHPRLTQLSQEAAREEIAASKKSLEDRFGIAIRHFCYPYGDWNEAVRDLVREAGYETACTTVTGLNVPSGSNLSLMRFTARYPSRSLKALWSGLRRWRSS
jgi:peptidoglycan/xylan/chitin deacetylase (PgdA/CDA1 family)